MTPQVSFGAALGALVVGTLAPAALGQGASPFPDPLLHVGKKPVDLAAADLNADGRADFVVVLQDEDAVAVALGAAGGGFATAGKHGVGHEPSSLVLADLDADGALDVVTCDGGAGTVTRRLGDGLGGFGAAAAFPLVASPAAIALADVDGGGTLDVVGASGVGASLALALGDGAGGFGAAAAIGLPAFVFPGGVALGDLNGDASPDAVASVGDGSLVVLLNSGSGTFGPPASFGGFSSFPSTGAPALGDLNHDGRLDVVATGLEASGYAIARVYRGDGAGGFAHDAHVVPWVFASVEAVDLDADGNLDLAAFGGYDGAFLQLGDGSGSFPDAAYTGQTRALADGSGIALHGDFADLDGDGALDLLLPLYGVDAVQRLHGDGSGSFRSPAVIDVDRIAYALRAADLNEDGALDVLISGYELHEWRPGDGAAGFGAPQTFSLWGRVREAADMNADGHLDLVAFRDNGLAGAVALALGDGSGGFTTSAIVPVDAFYVEAAIEDVDADGSLDVIATLNAGGVAWFRGDAAGGLAAPAPIVGEPTLALAAGDLDADGSIDVVSSYTYSVPATVRVSLGIGGGAFAPPAAAATLHAAGAFSELGDVTGDGRVDLAVGGRYVSTGWVLLRGDGAGGFVPPEAHPMLGIANALEFADADGDGRGDLVAAGMGLEVQRGDGAGAFLPGAIHGAPYAGALALGDLNGDGRIDALASSAFGARVAVLRNLGRDPAGVAPFGTGTPGCSGAHGLTAASAAAVGNADFELVGTGAPADAAGIVLVGDAADFAGTDLLGLGVLAHVDLASSSLVTALPAASDGAGVWRAAAPIPSDPSLAGATVYAQGFWAWGSCAPLASLVSSSRGLAITFLP